MMSRTRHLGLGPRLSWRRFRQLLAAVTGPLAARALRRRQMQALARLDDRLLSDIGITRAEALQETGPQDWDAPLHWVHRAQAGGGAARPALPGPALPCPALPHLGRKVAPETHLCAARAS